MLVEARYEIVDRDHLLQVIGRPVRGGYGVLEMAASGVCDLGWLVNEVVVIFQGEMVQFGGSFGLFIVKITVFLLVIW